MLLAVSIDGLHAVSLELLSMEQFEECGLSYSGDSPCRMLLWDLATGRCLHDFMHHVAEDNVAITMDGRYVISFGWVADPIPVMGQDGSNGIIRYVHPRFLCT